MNPNPFNCNALTFSISATTSASAPVNLPALGNSIRIVNEGPGNAFISVHLAGTNATLPTGTAANSSTTILSGEDCIFSINPNAILTISAISRSTSILNISVGEGV